MALVTQPKSYQYWAAIAATPADFTLDAGDYGLTIATLTGTSVQLFKLMPDGTTPAPVSAVITTAAYSLYTLPAGQYRIVLTAVTVFTATIEKVNVGRR
jgi:hypothetical protein